MNTHDLYDKVWQRWGGDAVIAKAIEECGELVAVLAKHQLNEDVYGLRLEKIVDEIADVTIMMEQLARIYGWGDVEQRIEFKRERLRELVESDLTNGGE